MNVTTALKLKRCKLVYKFKRLYYDRKTNEWVIIKQIEDGVFKEIYRNPSELKATEKLLEKHNNK